MTLVEFLHHNLNLTLEHVKIFISILISYPISFLYVYLFSYWFPEPGSGLVWKYLYHILANNLILFWLYETRSVLHIYVSVVVIYLLVLYLYFAKRKYHESQDKENLKSWLDNVYRYTFFGSFVYCFCHQFYIYIYISSDMGEQHLGDIICIYMIMTVKMTSLISDQIEDVKRDLERCNKEEKILCKNAPGLLSYLSYVFLINGFASGPGVSFEKFNRFIHGALPVTGRVDRGKFTRSIFSSEQMKQAFTLMLIIICCAVIWIPLDGYFPLNEPTFSFVCSLPFIQRLVYFHISILVTRLKYFIVWSLAEGSFILLGLSYEPSQDEYEKWRSTANLLPWKLETASTLKEMFEAWNTYVHKWLRYHVYNKINDKDLGLLMTFLCSSLWHGMSPGFHLMFSNCYLVILAEKKLWKKYKSTDPNNSMMIRIIRIMSIHVIVTYLSGPFMLLDLKLSLQYYQSLYFFGHIVPLTVLLLL